MKEESVSMDLAPLGMITSVRSTRSLSLNSCLPFAAPSMFGRDLIDQVRADAKGSGRMVPVIVEKCVDAVEVLGKLSENWLCSFDDRVN